MAKEKKYEMLVRRSREIMNTYTDKLSIRQLYYRLVSAQDILNNRSQYVYFDKVLTEYRQNNLDFAKYFEDRTRTIQEKISVGYPNTSFSQKIEYEIESVLSDYPTYYVSRNVFQNQITLVLVEKQALETIFRKAIGQMAILVVARGFNSFTQMYELRQLLKNDDREVHVKVFTDFDDSGLLIQNNFLNQMRKHLKIHFTNVERVALTKELVEKYDLPTNPTKKSTHSKYNLPYFVELDALEPNVLRDMVSKECAKHFDFDLSHSVQKALRLRNRRLKKAYFRELKKIDLSDIDF